MNTSVETRELELIKQGDKTLLKELYAKFRTPFLKWAHWRYTDDPEEIYDVYQQAFTIFYFNVRDGKFDGLHSSIKTYLFGIGKNLLNKKYQSKALTDSIDDIKEINLPTENIFDRYENNHRQQLVNTILANVGEPCKSILEKYYFQNFTMEAIAENMGYKTAMVAKKKKCECLIKIRKALQARSLELNIKGE